MALNFDLGGNDQESSLVPYIRLVPAGMKRLPSGKFELRAALLFSPIPDPAKVSPLRLSNWPVNASRIFTDDNLRFQLVVHGPNSGTCVAPDNGVEAKLTLTRIGADNKFPDVFADKAADLAQLWRDALIPDTWQGKKVSETEKTQVWNALLECIRKSLAGDRSKVGKIKDNPNGQPLEDGDFGSKGQLVKSPAKDERTVDTILSVPYTDTAIALDQRRTNALIGSIRKALGGEKGLPTLPETPFEDVTVVEKSGEVIGEEEEFVALDTTEQKFAYIGRFTGFAATQVTKPEPPNMGGSFPIPAETVAESDENKQTRAFDRCVLWKYAIATGEIELEDTKESYSLKKYRDLFSKALREARKENLLEIRRASKIKRHGRLATEKLAKQREEAVKTYKSAAAALGPNKATVVCRYRAYEQGQLENDEAQTEQIQRATDAAEYGHWPQHTEDGAREQMQKAQGLLDCAAQTYFSIEGNPTLARAFGLAVDLYFEVDALPSDARYGILSANLLGHATELPQPWTLTKLSTGAADDPFGWPVTMAEYLLVDNKSKGELPPESQHCIGQYDGLYVMGADNTGAFEEELAPANEDPRTGVATRYELTTMDVRAALEAEDQRLRGIETESVSGGASEAAKAAQRDTFETGPDFQSLGLVLLCRSAQSDAIRRLAAIEAKCGVDGSCIQTCSGEPGKYVIHDAEDVTAGFRLMIGMPKGGGSGAAWRTNWRPLTARSVQYGGSGKGGSTVERVLRSSVGRNGSDQRIALESAFQALPTRDLKAPGGNGGNIETIVDETVGIWDGSPGGVDCTAVRGQREEMEDIMPFGRINRVPTRSSSYKVFPLRNGLPYRIAMAVAYAGGHSLAPEALPADPLPVDNASDNVGIRERLYYPSARLARSEVDGTHAKPYFRALRQSRVAAPSVMLPEGHSTRKNGPMGFEHAGKMVVRSWRAPDIDSGLSPDVRDSSRAQPLISQRILMVPSLPQALAARHLSGPGTNEAVFDDCTSAGPPQGAHRELEYNNLLGFPAVKTLTKPGFNGEPHLVERSVARTASDRKTGVGEALSDLVFMRPRLGQSRFYTYYPDPAADKLVVRARRASKDKTGRPLSGSPVTIDLGSGYPNKRNVLFTMRNRKSRPGGATPKQSEIIQKDRMRNLVPRFKENIISTREQRIKAYNVELHLEPGDQFDIDCWYVPSGWRLAHDFAAVQALSARLTRLGRPATQAELEAAVNRAGLPDEFTCYLSSKLESSSTGVRYIGPEGTHMPDTGFLRAVGNALHEFMLEHPIAEISGVRTITAVHAVNVPATANRPQIRSLNKSQEPFPDPSCPISVEPGVLRAVRPAELGLPISGYSDRDAISEGSTLCVLKGSVRMNLERVDTLEILARTVSPETDRFDDVKRGRSLAQRISNTWPTQIGSETKAFRKASSIFGFGVNRDGTTELPKATVSLLRIDGLPHSETSGMSDFVLDDYFLEIFGDESISQRAVEDGVTSRRHAFPDGKARRMRVWINGMARTAEEMKTAAREMQNNDPWKGGSGIVYENGELIPAEPLSPVAMRRLSNEVDVILPATIRPAVPDARAPVPVFEAEQTIKQLGNSLVLSCTRKVRIRIPLGRGWYSSGEDERLGVVLWPPDQMLVDKAWLAINRIPLRDHDTCETAIAPGGFAPPGTLGEPVESAAPTRIADLPQFSDEDLGPGGSFITRRGSDPVRRGEKQLTDETQVFLSKETFSDLWAPDDSPGRAEFVPHVNMPLADKETGTKSEERNDANKENDSMSEGERGANEATTPPLAVALVTYRPRFDPEREEWYADVLLQPGKSADPFIRFGLVRYQPHTRPDLRCSRPITQWAQMLPERKVEFICTPDAQVATLMIQGPASKGRAVEGKAFKKYADEQAEPKRIAPIMRVTAFTEGKSPAGVATRDTVPLDTEGNFEIEIVAEVDRFGRGVWKAEIPMSLVSADLNLLIEEIEYFLPADFDDEPLTLDDIKEFKESLWRETGPRFSAQISLEQVVGMMAD